MFWTSPKGNGRKPVVRGSPQVPKTHQNGTNPLGQITRYEYDALNRLKKVTDPLAGMTQFDYDPNSNLLKVTDARANFTEYTYDNLNRLKTRIDPLGGPGSTETYAYDEAGNLRQFTDRNNQTTTYTYDALNRRRTVTYQDTSNTTYTYDEGNRLRSIVDCKPGCETTTRGYDDLDRLTSETTPQGSITYTHDKAGRRETMTVAGQPQITYMHDDINRLKQITQSTSTVTIGYDNASRRTSLTLPNGVLVEYGYDLASRVTGITYCRGPCTIPANVLGTLTYEYDAAGNRTKIGGTWARTNLPAAVTAGPYDAANRTSSFGDQAITYDNNGNITSFGPDTYNWNARNQLATISGGAAASFVYDGGGRRQKKTISASNTEFLYDGVNPVQEKDGGTVLANILTGLGIDEYFTRSIPADPTATRHLLGDALGSTVALADDAAAIQTEYTYEPFGRTTVGLEPNTNPFQFTGRENDGTGLYYYRARYHHPVFQRFISEDPIEFSGSNLNLYAYVRNNPLNYIDPLGLEEKCIPWFSRRIFEPHGHSFWRFAGAERVGGGEIPLAPGICFWERVYAGYYVTIFQKLCFDICNPRKGLYIKETGERKYEAGEQVVGRTQTPSRIPLPLPGGVTGDFVICDPPY